MFLNMFQCQACKAGDRAAGTRLEHLLQSSVATVAEENSVVRAISQSEVLAVHKRKVKVRLDGTNCAGLAQTTQLNFIGAAAALECWLSLEKSDNRAIEMIPPDLLDIYLAEFFPLLKRRNGFDYDPESFSNFRSFLDRFLKEKNYPQSIRSMSDFPKSSSAFKARRKALGLSFTVKRMLQHQTQPSPPVMPVDLSSSFKS